MLLTFDDGYTDHFLTVYPLLCAQGVTGAFFPPARTLNEGVLLDVNKIHFIMSASSEKQLFRELLREMEFFRGRENQFPDTKTLIATNAIPSRYDSAEIVFSKRMLQTVLPESVRNQIADKLFERFVGVPQSVFAKELYADTAQLKVMKQHGMYIGLHGYNHDRLGEMNNDEYVNDINMALDFMDSTGLLDKNSWVMCYPYGSYSSTVVEFLRSTGCAAGLTTQVYTVDLHNCDPLLLPRLDTNDYPPKSENYKDVNLMG